MQNPLTHSALFFFNFESTEGLKLIGITEKSGAFIIAIIVVIVALTVLGAGFTEVLNQTTPQPSPPVIIGSPVTDSTGLGGGSTISQLASSIPAVLIQFINQSQNYVLVDVTKSSLSTATIMSVYDCNTTTTTEYAITGDLITVGDYSMDGTHIYIIGFGSDSDGWDTAYTGSATYPILGTNLDYQREDSLVTPSCDATATAGNLHNLESITTAEGTLGTPAVADSNLTLFNVLIGILVVIGVFVIIFFFGKQMMGSGK